ncbi:hypothetical protein C8R44DRAFT_738421 [Mycena epipterygia]|nr:hypothetical protein C8R44DRAFT_738421 [Mycena epipterygia]
MAARAAREIDGTGTRWWDESLAGSAVQEHKGFSGGFKATACSGGGWYMGLNLHETVAWLVGTPEMQIKLQNGQEWMAKGLGLSGFKVMRFEIGGSGRELGAAGCPRRGLGAGNVDCRLGVMHMAAREEDAENKQCEHGQRRGWQNAAQAGQIKSTILGVVFYPRILPEKPNDRMKVEMAGKDDAPTATKNDWMPVIADERPMTQSSWGGPCESESRLDTRQTVVAG